MRAGDTRKERIPHCNKYILRRTKIKSVIVTTLGCGNSGADGQQLHTTQAFKVRFRGA
jgi:hypothetical protein